MSLWGIVFVLYAQIRKNGIYIKKNKWDFLIDDRVTFFLKSSFDFSPGTSGGKKRIINYCFFLFFPPLVPLLSFFFSVNCFF